MNTTQLDISQSVRDKTASQDTQPSGLSSLALEQNPKHHIY